MTSASSPDIIDGVFRVVATTELKPRPSPKRVRDVARMVFWNMTVMAAVVVIPILA